MRNLDSCIVFRLVLALTVVVFSSLPVLADDFICKENIKGGEFDDIIVPEGAICKLNGTRVDGSVTIDKNAGFKSRDTTIDGNIQAKGAKYIKILDMTVVDGAVQIEGTGSYENGSMIKICESEIDGDVQISGSENVLITIGCDGDKDRGNVIDGNLQVRENYWDETQFKDKNVIEIKFNRIDGDLQFFENHADDGKFWIFKNEIDGYLQCEENFPRPDSGGNRVSGDIEGQCIDDEACRCDLNGDGDCDGKDLFGFISDLDETVCNPSRGDDCECNLNDDDECNEEDLALFAEDWGRSDCPTDNDDL
jgi:hypothetical protein